MKPDLTYVTKLLESLRQELDVFHRKMTDVEDLRYFEDKIHLQPEEQQSGVEVRVGLTADMIENVKASMVSEPPVLSFKALRESDEAERRAQKREVFWNYYIKKVLWTELVEWIDGCVGLGMGVLKTTVVDWPKSEMRRRTNERGKDKEYLDRVKGVKKAYGPPFSSFCIHPLTFFPRFHVGNQLAEAVEHSYKPKAAVYRAFGFQSDEDVQKKAAGRYLGEEVQHSKAFEALLARATPGYPDAFVRTTPMGFDTSIRCLVTEYWSPDWYQVYVDRGLIWEQENPSTKYIIARSHTTSSKDPDKLALSCAEALRHNEPTLNRGFTRLFEATDLVVRKRNTLELPEDSVEPLTDLDEKTGLEIPRTYNFDADKVTALPYGAKVVDPFAGVEAAYQSLPALNMLMSLMGNQGLSPIFKGMSPGAGGSGYRDNSLYMMASQKYKYYILAMQRAIVELVTWYEYELTRSIDAEIFCGEHSITPTDVRDWPCEIECQIKSNIPQNVIATASLYDRMHARGHIPSRMVLEKGLMEEDPSGIERDVILEQVQRTLMPLLIQDVVTAVTGQIMGQPQPGQQQDMGSNTPQRDRRAGQGGAEQAMNGNGMGRPTGREFGGYASQGVGREPPIDPGSTPGAEGY